MAMNNAIKRSLKQEIAYYSSFISFNFLDQLLISGLNQNQLLSNDYLFDFRFDSKNRTGGRPKRFQNKIGKIKKKIGNRRLTNLLS